MALLFFTQRDIDSMSVDDIPEEFVNYFNGLSEERKKEIISSRPDLAVALKYGLVEEQYSEDIVEEDELDGENISAETMLNATPAEFREIENNLYEGMDLEKLLVDDMEPVEALSIRENQKKCILHRKLFQRVQITYRKPGQSSYGLYLYFCKECNRVFVDSSRAESHSKLMDERNINHKFYDIELTERYLKSKITAIELEEGEKVYIPDVWVEENPCCPVHKVSLEQLPYVKKYKDRSVSFTGYHCDQCKKIILRRSRALELEDECADNGVPMIEYELLTVKKPEKKPVAPKEIKPAYFVENGKKKEYTFSHIAECFKLTEEDTVVISDSRYCDLEGHDTEEVLVLIWVNQKRGGRQTYLCLAGYCEQCQKYYLDEFDYKVLYAAGRPEVTVVTDVNEDDYLITSGEVFNIEKAHLHELEVEIDGAIEAIKNQPDYVSQSETIKGGYDDGGLKFAKERSKTKYEPKIKELNGYIPKPYTYRVDITFAGKTETYYLGQEDITLDSITRVISLNSYFGSKLVHYRTTNIQKDGKVYDIKLSRRLEIDNSQLYGYENLRTDEDLIFRSGVTDPFLIRALNTRKKHHSLIDIYVTIQENQNKIVDAPFKKNVIVQGCAGSGKTMVLLHRLSSLKYNHPEFDFTSDALILTPNEQFNLHIKGLAEGMQIGRIERVSVEQYYVDMLLQYSEEFKPNNKLTSETFVKQTFVDYIYSDDFLEQFKRAYATVIEEQKKLIVVICDLAVAMGEERTELIPAADVQIIPLIRRKLEHCIALESGVQREITDAKKKLDEIYERKVFLDEQIPKTEEFAAKVVKDTLPCVYSKIGQALSEVQYNIEEQRRLLNSIMEEAQRVNGALIPFGKKARLEELKNKSDSASKKLKKEEARKNALEEIFDNTMSEKADEEVLAWMQLVALQVPEVKDDIRVCDRAKDELLKYMEEFDGIEVKTNELRENYLLLSERQYSNEVHNVIAYLREQTEKHTVIDTFNQIFELAISDYVKVNNVKNIKGTHRYDLYAQLLFAMKFYRKRVGMAKFICVDEGQDISINEYKMIYELNHQDVIFNIFGDTNQLLKLGRGICDWSVLRAYYDAEQFVLNENYRNTNQITRFCNDSFDMNVLQTGVDGTKVKEIPRKEFETELSNLVIGNQRIAILVPRSVRKSNYLDKSHIANGVSDAIGEVIDNGKIAFMYVDEVKGIEFDKVYVIPNKMTKNEKYIAYTRALSELIIVVDESIPEVSDNGNAYGKTVIGELVDLIKQERVEEASEKLREIIEGQNEKQKCGLFKHLFSRVFPNRYTCLIRIMWPALMKHSIKGLLSALETDVLNAIRNKVDMQLVASEMYYASEYEKLCIWLDTFELWESLGETLQNISRKDLLLKISTSKSLATYYTEELAGANFDEAISFLMTHIEFLDGKFVANKCVELYLENKANRLQIIEVLKQLFDKNNDAKNRFSISYQLLMEVAAKISSDEEDFEFLKFLIEEGTMDRFSLRAEKRYAQETISEEMQKALDKLVASELSDEQIVYVFMNTKLHKEIQLNKFLSALYHKNKNEEIAYLLRDYWFVGEIKYVTEDGFVRVAPLNISSTRLLVFDSRQYHVTGKDGTWMPPNVGDRIYFKIKKYTRELDLFSLDYPCQKIEYVRGKK